MKEVLSLPESLFHGTTRNRGPKASSHGVHTGDPVSQESIKSGLGLLHLGDLAWQCNIHHVGFWKR